MNQPSIYLLPFSHLDLGFLGDREQALSRGNRIISAALGIMQRHPEFRFLLEDMVFVDDYLQVHPERLDELRAQVKAGRMEVGAKWAGIFQNLQLGEDLVRNLICGKQFVREHFGVDPDTVHLGDLPGYTLQYPQILARGGVKGVVICRGGPADQVLYRWQSPDGSTVLTWNALKSYVWAWRTRFHHTVDEAFENGQEEQAREVMALTPAPILMHWGIDLVVPPEELVKNLHEWNERSELKMRFASSSEYFEEVARIDGIATLRGEVPSVWALVEPGGIALRTMNAASSYSLLTGEMWSELARRLGLPGYPQARITEGWKAHLQGMDHNGGGGFAGYARNVDNQLRGRLTGEEATRAALRQIAENVKIPNLPDITPVIVFNSTSWTRSDIADACVAFHGEVESFYAPGRWFDDRFANLALFDHTGRELPFQYIDRRTEVTREARITFMAENVPALGYKAYYLLPVAEEKAAAPCCQVNPQSWNKDSVVIESSRIRLEIANPSGQVTLTDKALKRTLAGMTLQAQELMPFLKWFDHRPTGRVFPYAPTNIHVAENGAVRARIVLNGQIGCNTIDQEWIIYRDTDYIDIIDHVTWGEHPTPVLLQRVIPTGIDVPEVNYGVPFGANNWDNKLPNTGPHLDDEYPLEVVERFREILYWIDVSDSVGGITVATDRRVVEREGGVLKLAHMVSDKLPPGVHEETFVVRTRLRMHDGDWRAARAYRAGVGLHLPLVGVSEHDPVTAKRLEPEVSLCADVPDTVIVTAIKRAETGEGTILRGFEAIGQEITGTPRFFDSKVQQISEVDLMEEHPQGVGQVVWRPYEIKTLRYE